MKKLITLIAACFSLLNVVLAQIPPQAFNYNGVARDLNNIPVANSTVAIQMSIRQNSAMGAIAYQENHIVTTDPFGLFNIAVGTGSVQSGVMSNIDWGGDNFYLETAIDINGGTAFLTISTTQLMSVPYAMHADAVKNVVSGAGTGSSSFLHYPGEVFGGGVVFYVYHDSIGSEHGLIVSLADQSTSQAWSNISTIGIGVNAQSAWSGLSNCNATVAQPGHISSAASVCLNLTSGGQNDWYLPTMLEIGLLWNNIYDVNKTLSALGGANQINGIYWTSREANATLAFLYDSFFNEYNAFNKATSYKVRAIRSF